MVTAAYSIRQPSGVPGSPAEDVERPRGSSTWSTVRRLLLAAAVLIFLLVANASAVHGNAVFVVSTHVPLLALYVAAFRTSLTSGAAAIGLVGVTAWVWWAAARADHADERAFAVLTNWVLWIAVLVVSAATGVVMRRRDPRLS